MPESEPHIEMPATLREIIDRKREEVAEAKSLVPASEYVARIADEPAPRGFFEALTAPTTSTRVIAEVKRRSPSAGLIRPEYDSDGFDPSLIAQQYSKAGASAISCLTDEKFFGGDLRFLRQIKEKIDLPVLRKDFMIDPYQVLEARAHGADAILLIAECLSDTQIREMLELSHTLGLSALLEVHSRDNLIRAVAILKDQPNPRTLLGINNRDLTRMVTDLAHTTELLDLVTDRSTLVSESGIRTQADLEHLRSHGVHITLIGEHLMRQDHPGRALEAMLGAGGPQ